MTLLSYQVFKAVVEQSSFQKASKVLGITPSAVSHAIASMENELGAALFIRSKNGILLTSFGRSLLPYVNGVLNSEQTLQQAISALGGIHTGKVTLGTFSSTCTNWVPNILHTCKKNNPDIEVDIYEGTYEDIEQWLRTGIIDFGFQSSSAGTDLPFLPLHLDPLLCVLPKGHKKKDPKDHITFDEIRYMPFIMIQETVGSDIKDYMKNHQITSRSGCHIKDDLSALVMVESGFGYTVMPELVLKGIPYAVDAYPFEEPGYRVVGLTTLNYDSMSPAARLLYDAIVSMYRQDDIERKINDLLDRSAL